VRLLLASLLELRALCTTQVLIRFSQSPLKLLAVLISSHFWRITMFSASSQLLGPCQRSRHLLHQFNLAPPAHTAPPTCTQHHRRALIVVDAFGSPRRTTFRPKAPWLSRPKEMQELDDGVVQLDEVAKGSRSNKGNQGKGGGDKRVTNAKANRRAARRHLINPDHCRGKPRSRPAIGELRCCLMECLEID